MFKMVDGKKVPMTDVEIAARTAEEAAEAAKPTVVRETIAQKLAAIEQRIADIERKTESMPLAPVAEAK